MARGYFCLVLHSHIPYVRGAGAWPFGEETLFQVMAGSYIPLLNAVYDLVEDGHSPLITIGLTPVLLEQLADRQLLRRFQKYLRDKKKAAEQNTKKFRKENQQQFLGLAQFYAQWYAGTLDSLRNRFRGDLIAGFRNLQDQGYIEIITSAATHGYLPLLDRDSSIYAQLKVGIETYNHHFGRAPRGIWLPECGYRPPYLKDGRLKPGVADFLSEIGLTYFFTDTHALRGGPLLGIAAGDVIGPYALVPKRILIERPLERPTVSATTFRPYLVEDTPVAVFSRNERTGLQVWSASEGYPGDFDYREFHRQAEESGLQYWRITSPTADLGQKDIYHPEWAEARYKEHARHFAGVIAVELETYPAEEGPGIVVAAYDTELFGHWWFEGVSFLKELLRILASHPQVELSTASKYLQRYPPKEAISLPESSWGQGGGHDTWLNPQTQWMWPLIQRAEVWMEELVAIFPTAKGRMRRTIEQAGRELLLLQASDWPFLMTTGQAKEFATARFQKHLSRFHYLASIAQKGKVDARDAQYLKEVEAEDNPFPEIDYRVFARREE
ncbi:MAG: DUF1957 domain-containing protein [Chloroflexi bacterium]|nr:DUF1957 domain-containing protein [Chloroflexota bacterium]